MMMMLMEEKVSTKRRKRNEKCYTVINYNIFSIPEYDNVLKKILFK